MLRISTIPDLEHWLSSGGMESWRTLARLDEHASFFQDVPWCVTWYRAYAHQAEPRILAGYVGDRLVWLAALARLKSNGALTWAGHTWADYRDVISEPEWREAAVGAVLTEFSQGSYRSAFMWGFTQPASPSLATVGKLAPAMGVGALATTHPCYRTSLDGTVPAATYQKKESVRRHLSAFRRRGAVECLRIRDANGWAKYRDVFFEHHSLRQLSAERETSFDDPAKQNFYDRLFDEFPEHMALHVLEVAGTPIAEHLGFVWQDTLYFGAPAYDVLDQRRSPGQVLLALMLQDAESMGIHTMDLTIGESSYKQRFGTERVELPNAQLYVRGARWWLAATMRKGVQLAKAAVTKRGGDAMWERLRSSVQKKAGAGTSGSSPFLANVSRESSLPVSGRSPLFIVPAQTRVSVRGDDPSIVLNDLRPMLGWGDDVAERGALVRLLLLQTDAGSRLLIARQGSRICGWALLRPATPASKDTVSTPAALHGVMLDSRFDEAATARSILAAACNEAQDELYVFSEGASNPLRAAATDQ